MTPEDERGALCALPLAEAARLEELPALIQAYELGKRQAEKIHQGEARCVQVWVGGSYGSIGSFYERSPSRTVLEYAQMVIAAGVFLEDVRDRGGCLEVVDSAESNGKLVMKQISIQDIDLHCVRAQLLGLLHAFDGKKDNSRAIGIIGNAILNDIFNPKVRKKKELDHYAEMVAGWRESI